MAIDMSFDALRCCFLFHDLDDEALGAVVEAMDEREYKGGESLFTEGSQGYAFYVVRTGSIELFKTLDDGRKMLVAELGAGDVFGEMALISDAPRSASCVLTDDTRLWRLSREGLESLEETALAVYASVVKNLATILCERLSTATTKAVHLLREIEDAQADPQTPTGKLEKSKMGLMDFLKSLDGQGRT